MPHDRDRLGEQVRRRARVVCTAQHEERQEQEVVELHVMDPGNSSRGLPQT